jgi:diguanylate cyclase (GGDEF)-like protein
LAERLRQMFAGEIVLSEQGQEIRCTISIGVAALLPGENARNLLLRADEATYEAKRQGRNCVCIAR